MCAAKARLGSIWIRGGRMSSNSGSVRRKMLCDIVRQILCSRRIQIGKCDYDVVRFRKNPEYAVHSRCATAVADASYSLARGGILESKSVFKTWHWSVDLTCSDLLREFR